MYWNRALKNKNKQTQTPQWSYRNNLQPDISKFSLWDDMSEFRYMSERQII